MKYNPDNSNKILKTTSCSKNATQRKRDMHTKNHNTQFIANLLSLKNYNQYSHFLFPFLAGKNVFTHSSANAIKLRNLLLLISRFKFRKKKI